MGIETAILVAASVAAAGYQASEQHSAQVDAKKDAKEQQSRLRQQQDDARVQREAALAARTARQRQVSMAAGAGYDSTFATSPLGLSGNPSGKTEFGQ